MKKRLAIIGAGFRCFYMFAEPIQKQYNDLFDIVAIYDSNIKRSEFYQKTLGKNLQIFKSADEMLKSAKPDVVLIASVDSTHAEYIIKSLESGADVLSEKPMCITDEQARQILIAEKKTGKKVTVTFNCRFMPYYKQIRDIVKSGKLGRLIQFNFEYMLGRGHGADYFRRWHRYMKNSGGLLIHKSSHHFDIANWIIGANPEYVSAMGDLSYYGKNSTFRGEKCRGCNHCKTCTLYADLSQNELINDIYFNCEEEDGYYRDDCCFKEDIDIYDNMSVSVKYSNNCILNYTLSTTNPIEGYRIHILGEDARLEAEELYYTDTPLSIKIFNHFTPAEIIPVDKINVMHGGGDERLREMLFRNLKDDFNQCSTSLDGAKAILIGYLANKSIQEKKQMDISKILKEFEEIYGLH